MKDRERNVYQQLLTHLSRLRDRERVWVAAPGEIDQWWRQRSQMELVSDGDTWRIEGPGSERACVAYAREKDDNLVFEIQHSSTGQLSAGILKHP